MADLPALSALAPFERDFAAWLAEHSGRVAVGGRRTVEQQRLMLSRLAGTEKTLADLLALKRTPDFFMLVKDIRHSNATLVSEAQRLAHEMYPEAIAAHRRALKKADQVQDYKAIPALTEPVWKRVLPVRSEDAAPPQVTITLTTERLAALAAPAIDVEVEELPLPVPDGQQP